MNNNLIGIGQLSVAQAPKTLFASGIGSCVVVCLYDKAKQVGGLAHIMLASKAPNSVVDHIKIKDVEDQRVTAPAKYVDTGIDNLITELKKYQVETTQLDAKIIGGSEMFKHITNNIHPIGSTNITAVKQKLAELHIPIVLEDLGGNQGRSISFFLSNGQIEIKKRMQ